MKLSSLKGCVTNEKIYFPVRHFNAVYDFDIIKKRYEYVMQFKDENITSTNLYLGVESNGQELCFIPSSAQYIIFYNIKTKKYEKLRCPHEIISDEYKFVDYIKIKNIIYMFPVQKKDFFSLDLNTREFKKINICDKDCECIMPLNYNNKIITIEKNSNCLMEFDLKLFETKFVQIRGAEGKKLSSIINDEDKLYLSFWGEKELIKLDKGYTIKKILNLNLQNDTIIGGIIYDNYLITRGLKNNIYLLNVNSNEFNSYTLKCSQKNKWLEGLGYDGIGRFVECSDKIYSLPGDYGSIFEIDKHSLICEEYISNEKDFHILKKIVQNGGLISEKEDINLGLFLQCM